MSSENIQSSISSNAANIFSPFHSGASRRIYNHDIMNCTAEGVVGNHLYSARILGMSEPDDLVQLHPDLSSQWAAICGHYERIGLSFSRNIIWDLDLEQLSAYPDYAPSVFFFGAHEQTAHADDDWFAAVDTINSKNSFMALAEQLGIPAPKTFCFNSVSNIPLKDAEGFPYPCYLKAAISVSGVGIYRCEDKIALLEAVKLFQPGIPVQIQEEVQSDCFLNMQYRVVDGRLERFLTTEQILDGCVHQGNRFPARQEPWDVVEPMAEWLFEHGFKDVFAFDVAVVEQENNVHFQAIECNPRFNGASYPTAIALKFGLNQWTARNVLTRYRTLEDIDLSGIEYDSRSGEGIILVNWGPILAGKLMVMLAGPLQVQEQLMLELSGRL